jgi:hypothetical protein
MVECHLQIKNLSPPKRNSISQSDSTVPILDPISIDARAAVKTNAEIRGHHLLTIVAIGPSVVANDVRVDPDH